MPDTPTPVEVGQVYRDVDRGRLIRVLFVANPVVHGVRRGSAACYASGKLTAIATDRLQNPSRYELVPQETAAPSKRCPMLMNHNGDGSPTPGCTCTGTIVDAEVPA